MKRCPKCKHMILSHCPCDEVSLDQCDACFGLWFDKGEMRQCKSKRDETLNWMDAELFSNPEKIAMKPTDHACPVCEGKKLMALDYDNTGVVVEYCISCQGLWLDKGEFDKIIQALHHRSLEQTIGEYLRAALEETKEVLTGPEPLAEELRDARMVVRLLQCRICSYQPKLAHTAAESVIQSVSDPDVMEGIKSFLG